jgi:hypothetical protein
MRKRFCSASARRAELRSLLTALIALLPSMAKACDLAGLPERITSPAATLAWRAEPKLSVGAPHLLDIAVCAAQGAARLVAVDAFMPAHGHGTNYRTEIAPAGAGRFRAEGLLLHMPGRWQLQFDIETPAGRERLVQEVEVE